MFLLVCKYVPFGTLPLVRRMVMFVHCAYILHNSENAQPFFNCVRGVFQELTALGDESLEKQMGQGPFLQPGWKPTLLANLTTEQISRLDFNGNTPEDAHVRDLGVAK